MKKEEKKFIAKEITEIKKLYLEQIEKFDSKIYFAFLSLSISLILLNFKIDNLWGIPHLLLIIGTILFLITTLGLETILDLRRKNQFNKLIEEIKIGKFDKIK